MGGGGRFHAFPTSTVFEMTQLASRESGFGNEEKECLIWGTLDWVHLARVRESI
jgi:hypothetical protein